MKTMKIFFGIVATTLLMASCLTNDDSYRAGFQVVKPSSAYYYANNTSDSLVFWSYGSWTLDDCQGYDNSWITIPTRKGNGYTDYSQLMRFTQNTTGEGRLALFQLSDTNHPSDAHASLAFWQYATRGDGTLGNAADVKSITGTDGSKINLTYDEKHRPLTVVMTKDGNTLQNLSFEYDDNGQQMTVNSRGIVQTSSYGNSYQPKSLIGPGDSLFLTEQFYVSSVNSPYAFNFVERFSTGDYEAYGILQMKPCSNPDSVYVADSIRYQCKRSGVIEQEFMALNYGQDDNRYQTVDVNQLILGVEHCNPYLLVSLYRLARSSRIVTSATFEQTDKNITVAARLNANKSVQQLSVTRRGTTISYDFEY